MYLGIALLCLTIVPSSFSDDDILKYMSPEEIRQVFNADHDSVPKFEIVKVHLSKTSHKRDLPAEHKMYIRAFSGDINLWLHPGDTVLAGEDTPVYYAKYSPTKAQGVEYTKSDGLMEMVGRIFENPRWLAAFVIGTENSGYHRINGHIASKRIAVRSLPLRVAEEYRRRRRAVGDSDDLDSPYHIVFQTDNAYEDNYPALPVNVATLRKRASRSTSAVPDTLYVELLVIVDYSMYKTYGRDIYDLLEYLLAFWNGVDLKYRSLESPKVRIHISAIVLSEDLRATPYISDNMLSSDAFNSSTAMVNCAQFYYAVQDTFDLNSYDIAITLTRQSFGLGSDAGVLGLANVGEACSQYKSTDSIESIGLVKDNGAFKGIIIAAHELGHLLGSPHDLSGGSCITQNGFMMSFTPWYTKNSSDFSPCTLKAFNAYLNANELDCLFNRPASVGKTIPKLMPGRMKTLTAQCEAMGYKNPCEKTADHDVCVNIYCLDDEGVCTETGTGAIDGTSCETGNKFCLHMECVSL